MTGGKSLPPPPARGADRAADAPVALEVAYRPETVYVRDSKEQDGPILSVSPAAWTNFLTHTAR
ncbi:DUF397 domain-containing protein [Streptomyces sp. TRM43335]|uniref:DUF397 domain-containing protein n=1 Tax=Streptomyces taklimakanensis TaxID=2569853 RepID=A0A6G2BHX4_9ACTN|nr:DUF397 domain-containing protein [Streptomyces taklimakanensis]MTE21663.1 DUF397 domain-containing protein [Streptomyces taklimakanensis]